MHGNLFRCAFFFSLPWRLHSAVYAFLDFALTLLGSQASLEHAKIRGRDSLRDGDGDLQTRLWHASSCRDFWVPAFGVHSAVIRRWFVYGSLLIRHDFNNVSIALGGHSAVIQLRFGNHSVIIRHRLSVYLVPTGRWCVVGSALILHSLCAHWFFEAQGYSEIG